MREELDLLDMKGRPKSNVEDADTLEERIYELDNKIEEYCNGIIEQFEKVAPKEDLITLRAESELKPTMNQIHDL